MDRRPVLSALPCFPISIFSFFKVQSLEALPPAIGPLGTLT